MFDILNFIGVVACACTGALQAGRQKMDYFGVLIISAVTALGGGSIRDVLLGHYPLSWVKDPWLLYVVVASTIATITIAPFFHYLKSVFLFLDALGLVAFALLGAQVALEMDYGLVLACVAGIMTGAFGGVLRDILCNRIPLAFQTELYASIALLCTLIYVLLDRYFLPEEPAMIIAASISFLIRLLAIRYSWSLPTFDYSDDKYIMANWMDGMPHKRIARRLTQLRNEIKLKQKEVANKRLIAQAAKNKLLKDVLEEQSYSGSTASAQMTSAEHARGLGVFAAYMHTNIVGDSEKPTAKASDQDYEVSLAMHSQEDSSFTVATMDRSDLETSPFDPSTSSANGVAIDILATSTLGEDNVDNIETFASGTNALVADFPDTQAERSQEEPIAEPQVVSNQDLALEDNLESLAHYNAALEASADLESSHQELVEQLKELKSYEEAYEEALAQVEQEGEELSTTYDADFSAAQAFSEVVGEEIESFSTWVKEVVEGDDQESTEKVESDDQK